MMSRPYSTDAQLKDVLRVRKSTWGGGHFVCEKTKPRKSGLSQNELPQNPMENPMAYHGLSESLVPHVVLGSEKLQNLSLCPLPRRRGGQRADGRSSTLSTLAGGTLLPDYGGVHKKVVYNAGKSMP